MERQEDISGIIHALRDILARLDSLEFSMAAIKVQETINMLVAFNDQQIPASPNGLGGKPNL